MTDSKIQFGSEGTNETEMVESGSVVRFVAYGMAYRSLHCRFSVGLSASEMGGRDRSVRRWLLRGQNMELVSGSQRV